MHTFSELPASAVALGSPIGLSGKFGRVTSLRPPDQVVEIARRLESKGFETWCVGGAIRDALLGHPHLDWDLATAAKPADVMRIFRRTVPVGIAFGTVGVLQAKLDARNHPMELHVYEAAHAFVNDTRPEVYDAANAKLAWNRTVAFFKKHL